jgi:hypothetical protein
MTEIHCPAKHTKWQPKEDQWVCPRCGAGKEEFNIEEPDSQAHEECGLLHEFDELRCLRCDYANYGKDFSLYCATTDEYETCPCCGGLGKVHPDQSGYYKSIKCQI